MSAGGGLAWTLSALNFYLEIIIIRHISWLLKCDLLPVYVWLPCVHFLLELKISVPSTNREWSEGGWNRIINLSSSSHINLMLLYATSSSPLSRHFFSTRWTCRIKSWSLRIFWNYFCEWQNRIMDECAGNKSRLSSRYGASVAGRRRHKSGAIIPSSLHIHDPQKLNFHHQKNIVVIRQTSFCVVSRTHRHRHTHGISFRAASSVRSSGKMNEIFNGSGAWNFEQY